jgi:hypothetical protein
MNHYGLYVIKDAPQVQIPDVWGVGQLTVLLDEPHTEPREGVPSSGKVITQVLAEPSPQALVAGLTYIHKPIVGVQNVDPELIPEIHVSAASLGFQYTEKLSGISGPAPEHVIPTPELANVLNQHAARNRGFRL